MDGVGCEPMRSTARRQPGAPAPPAERVPAPCPRSEADGTLPEATRRATIWQVRDGSTVHAGSGAQHVPEEPNEGSPSVDPAAPRLRTAGRAPRAGSGGFRPCDNDGARGDHRRRRRRDLVGGRGGGRHPGRHVGETGSRGHPRAAADRQSGCRAHHLRGPVRRLARRSEGCVCRVRDDRGRRFGLRDAAAGARADRRA